MRDRPLREVNKRIVPKDIKGKGEAPILREGTVVNLLDLDGGKYAMWFEQDPRTNSRIPRTVRLTEAQAKTLKTTDEELGDGYGN